MIKTELNSKHLFKKQNSSSLLLWMMVFLLMPAFIFAQQVNVSAKLDTNSIIIGKQAKLTLTAEYETGQGELKIFFPILNDTLSKHIEIVNKTSVEKYLPDSNDLSRMAQRQVLTITSFDSGFYAIPPLKFYVNNDTAKTFETQAMLLSVISINVDTTKAFMDIKPPLEVPFSWKEYLPYVYQGLTLLAILAAAIYFLVKYLKSRKKKPLPPIIAAPKIPIHITTLEKLEKLKEEKLWQQGKLKQYHSELADIVRQYIEQRFFINAMEQVTDEIMYAFRRVDISDEAKAKLRNVLFLSDLVKFAKEHPLPAENESSWTHAVEFVQTTKQEVKAPITPTASNPPQQTA